MGIAGSRELNSVTAESEVRTPNWVQMLVGAVGSWLSARRMKKKAVPWLWTGLSFSARDYWQLLNLKPMIWVAQFAAVGVWVVVYSVVYQKVQSSSGSICIVL